MHLESHPVSSVYYGLSLYIVTCIILSRPSLSEDCSSPFSAEIKNEWNYLHYSVCVHDVRR
jgi:hypothetical protein